MQTLRRNASQGPQGPEVRILTLGWESPNSFPSGTCSGGSHGAPSPHHLSLSSRHLPYGHVCVSHVTTQRGGLFRAALIPFSQRRTVVQRLNHLTKVTWLVSGGARIEQTHVSEDSEERSTSKTPPRSSRLSELLSVCLEACESNIVFLGQTGLSQSYLSYCRLLIYYSDFISL